jgi:hypothetical protein
MATIDVIIGVVVAETVMTMTGATELLLIWQRFIRHTHS